METTKSGHVLAISGGIGGAKLALGLAMHLPPQQLTIACNIGDDFTHLGLSISPDLDTVMYTLAGVNNREQGWGLAGESWTVMDQLAMLGGPTWFQLGDLDLATHLQRTQRLAEGAPLSTITLELCKQLGIGPQILPASDDTLRTIVQTEAGWLNFQEYFVRDQCRPAVRGLRYKGMETARPQPDIAALLRGNDLACVVICPSNPYLSIDPVLNIHGMRELLKQCAAPVVAVSPLVGGKAIKGPTTKIMAELGIPATAAAIAAHYGDLIDGLIIDVNDAGEQESVTALGIKAGIYPTVMNSLEDRRQLAGDVLHFALALKR